MWGKNKKVFKMTMDGVVEALKYRVEFRKFLVEIIKSVIDEVFVTCTDCNLVMRTEDAKWYEHRDIVNGFQENRRRYYYCEKHAPNYQVLTSVNGQNKKFFRFVKGTPSALVEVNQSGNKIRK